MRVCYFGTYHSSYPGNNVLIEGLRRNGIEVTECHYPVSERYQNKAVALNNNFKRLLYLSGYIQAYIVLIFRYLFGTEEHDCLIVGYLGQFDMLVGRFLKIISRKPIAFNPMFSLYDTIVLDRQLYPTGSFPAKIIRGLDLYSSRFADIVFLDNKEHARIWTDKVGCNRDKIRQLCFGADDKIFYPRQGEKKDDIFKILFYGTFMPMQGIPVILRATKLLESETDILFEIIGYGQVSGEVRDLSAKLDVKNIDFIRWVEFNELPEHIAEADVCLGVFGTTPKTKRCFANKVVQAMAMAKPIITADTQASREFLVDKGNALFCAVGDPRSLADSILLLKRNPELRRKIGMGAYELFREKFCPESVGARAKEYLENLCSG